MTDAILSPVFRQQFLNANGKPVAFGKLYSYVAGSAGGLNKDTYSSILISAVNPNPVILDSGGCANVWLDPAGIYLLVLKDSLGNTIWSVDQVKGSPGSDVAIAAIEALLIQSTGAGLIGTLNGDSVQSRLNAISVASSANTTNVASLLIRVTTLEADVLTLKKTAISGIMGYKTWALLNAAYQPYSGATVYSNGNTIVDQSAWWIYTNVAPGSGNAPPILPTTSNAYWTLKTALPVGQLVEVPLTDTGTHTDPVVGGTVPNTGVFRWSTVPAGFERIYATEAAMAAPYSDAAAVSAANAANSEVNAFNSAVAAAAVITSALNPAQLVMFSALQSRRVSKLYNQSIASNAVLADDPDLQVILPANTRTLVKGLVNYATGTTGGFKFRLLGPGSTSAIQLNRKAFAPGASVFSAMGDDVAFSGADIPVTGGTGSGHVEFEGIIDTGAVSGTFKVAWAQNASDAVTTTVKGGSRIDYSLLPFSNDVIFANTGIAKLGAFLGPTFSGGHNVMTPVGPTSIPHSYIETMINGTEAKAQLFAGTYTINIDNGPDTIITAPAGWTFVTMFTGLGDVTHRLRISQGVAYDSDIALRVTGTSPSVARPPDIPNFYPLGQAPYDGYIAQEGVSLLDNTTGAIYQRVWSVGSGFGVVFSATTTSVRVWVYSGGSTGPLVLLQDGVVISTITPSSTPGRYELVTLATGLTGLHVYEIKVISMSSPTFLYAILVDTLTASAQVARPCDGYYGDSIVSGQSSGSADSRITDAYILATAVNRSAIRVGVGGTGVSVDASGNLSNKYGRDHTANIIGVTSTPSRVFVCYGVNDLFFTVPLATFQADYLTMLGLIRTGLPSAKIYARGILPQYRNTNADRLLYNARIQAAVTAFADANCVYINTDGWISVTPGVDLVDSVHPNTSGYAKIAAAQQLVL